MRRTKQGVAASLRAHQSEASEAGQALAGGAIRGLRPRRRRIQVSRRRLESLVSEQTRQLAAVNAVASVTSRSLHLKEMLAGALAKTLEVTDLEAGGLYLRQERSDHLSLVTHQGLGESLAAAIDPLQVGEGFSGRVAQTGEPLIVPDLADDPRLTRLAVQEGGFHSLAVVPLVARDRVLGTLFAMTRGYREFAAAEVHLLTAIGRQIGVAVENACLYEAAERRAQQFRTLNEIGQRITSILDVDELLRQVARLIHQRFGCYLVVIGVLEGDELVFRIGAGDFWDELSRRSGPVCLKMRGQSVAGWVAARAQACLVRDVRQEPRYVAIEGSRTRSEFIAPILAAGRVLGVLDVESDRPDNFDDTEVDLITALANQLGIALENARLFAAEQRRAEQFRVIAEVGRRFTTALEIDVLLQQAVELIQQAFGYYHVGIGLIEGDEVVYRAGAGVLWDDPAFQFKPARLRVGVQGLSGWVAARGLPLCVPDVSQDPRYVLMQGSQARSELVVPIVVKGETVGVLDVQSDRPDAFDQKDQAVLESLANQTGAAIENARLYQRARQLAVMEERSRLSRDLHDSVTQALYGMTLYAQAAAGQLAAGNLDQVAEHLRELQNTSQEALAEMRLLIFELRPPVLQEDGLVAALRTRLSAVEGRSGLKTELTADIKTRLPLAVEEGLYRIAQEALNNILKHACARRVVVRLADVGDGRGVSLTVADDGSGFDPVAAQGGGGLGLADMEERAARLGGRLVITSRPGEGAQVYVEVNR